MRTSSVHGLLSLLVLGAACSHGGPAAGPDDAPTPSSPSHRVADALTELPAPPTAPAPATPDASPSAPELETPSGSYKTLRAAVVRAQPRSDATALGLIAAGVRLPRTDPIVTPECEQGWLPVEPTGFVCTQLEADRRDATDAVLPRVPKGMRVPGAYGRVRGDNVKVYDSIREAVAGIGGRTPAASLTVRRLRTIHAGGRTFWKTRHGIIESKHVGRLYGSNFAGVELGDDVALPLAWTVGHYERKRVAVYAEPSTRSRITGKLPKRKAHALLEQSENGRWIRLEAGWVAAEDLRVSRAVQRPEAAGADERWLDIDLSEQTLVAYQGDTPVFATLISSGRPGHKTPTGVFRLDRKVAERTMNSMADSDDLYSVDKVPWTAYFATGYALHAAFWHSGFGTRRSHGCINLSPLDARRLYGFTTPRVAPNWAEVYGHEEQPGSVVQIRSARNPQPELRGYAANLASPAIP